MALVTAVIINAFLVVPAVHAADSDLSYQDKLLIQDQIMKLVRAAYVDTSMNPNILMDGAIKGIMDNLDPHSSFMPVAVADDFNEKIQGNFEGIGITFAMIDGKITVIQVIEGGPSEAAGLRSRDKIVKIGDKDVVGIEQDAVKDLLRGEAKTDVEVVVERPGTSDNLTFTIIRDRVNLNSVSNAFMFNDETGYVKVTKFTLQTHFDVSDALRKLNEQGMKRLVLDLRSNSGGSLDAAVRLVDMFFGEKGLIIVETKGKRRADNISLVTSGEGAYADIPLIVMINHASASASEIVAGALQDHDRALIVGQTSFGKGLVMNPFRLHEGRKQLGSLVLSTAHYYTPSGRLIQRPYDKGREEYIREGFDDVDPNAADSSKAGLPVYYTDLGRQVFGGGGITPDKTLAPLKRLNSLERDLRNTNLFFEFADGYLLRHNDIPADFEKYLNDYIVPENEIDAFSAFMVDKGIIVDRSDDFDNELSRLLRKYDLDEDVSGSILSALHTSGFDLSESLLRNSRYFIGRELKGEIARMLWGDNERFRIWQTDDTELYGALSYFEDADDLLRRRLALGKVENDRLRGQ
jgi:carboxyl-terminal processing protease